MATVIAAQQLAKTYGAFRALKGISFAIEEGECFGFLGHNGAGKSTTMRMIYGMSQVTEGELSLFGQTVRGLTPPALKGRLGVVPQEDNLDPDLSVIDNLEIYGGYFGLERQVARERGLALLEFMGLSDKADGQVETLSGGNKRRLVIARALINQPDIIILDEPTTGLDPQARRLVWQKLRQLKQQGVTLLLTTHYMEEASQLCDRLVIMNEGEILAAGTPEELVAAHVPPFVIEVQAHHEWTPALADSVAAIGGELKDLDGLFIFAEQGRAVWERLAEAGLPQHMCFLRPANLEDVYLRLTGRREDA